MRWKLDGAIYVTGPDGSAGGWRLEIEVAPVGVD